MDNKLKQQALVISKIQEAVRKANTLTEALEGSFKVLLEKGFADYVVAWYQTEENSGILAPKLWICPKDLTNSRISSGNGFVGKAFSEKAKVQCLDYEKGTDPDTDSLYEGLDPGSVVCVPVETSGQYVGCVEFLNTKKEELLEPEISDIYEMLTLFIFMMIDENENLHSDKPLSEVLLSARGIEKTYVNGDVITPVLKGVDLDIYKGEFAVILGESGCGKSTFLNVISGLDTANAGEFCFMGKKLTHANDSELTEYRRYQTGFIFQSYNLMPNLTAKQNLELIADLVKDPMNPEEALALVGLEDRKDNYPSQLSGGQQQRISIARALVKKPVLIFADEPTAALDYTTSIEVLTSLENVIRKGTTLVMVTHNEEIAKMADRVIRMRNGRTYEITVNRHPCKAKDLVW